VSVIALSHGDTHYDLTGPTDGRPVVLLHGGSVPMWTWDRQVPALAGAGFRVLRYDMFGRGQSALPAASYDRDLFRAQLLELLDGVGIERPAALVGFSFGGATAANFTVRHPDRVERLALVAPIVHFDAGNPVVRATRLPLIGASFLRLVVLKKLVARASLLWGEGPGTEPYAGLLERQMAREGFDRALLSFMRGDALGDYRETFRALGRSGCRVLLVWGTADTDVPARDIALLRDVIPRAEYVEIEGVGHGSVFRAADRVNQVLLEFLGGTSGSAHPWPVRDGAIPGAPVRGLTS
jgi:pimeloyl-ACP methyl ester carboxylesterase